jgi:hypothetical protein
MRWVWHVARTKRIKAYKSLCGKLEVKRPRGRPTRRCEDNIRMDLKEVGHEGVDWMHLA